MELKSLLLNSSGLLMVFMTLVQIAPININPWSALAKLIGRAVNVDIYHRLDDIETKIDGHIIMDDRRTADNRRSEILHFNNELLRPIEHTREEFVEILAKIDEYERYCEGHPEYPNNRAVLAIENIREVYKDHLKKRDFLQESHPKSNSKNGI